MNNETALGQLLHAKFPVHRIQQVSHLFPVHLKEAAAQHEFCGVVAARRDVIEDLLHSAWHYSPRGQLMLLQLLLLLLLPRAATIGTHHAVCLATACLPISKDSAVVATEDTIDNGPSYVIVDGFL
jgi:hypothetical protein